MNSIADYLETLSVRNKDKSNSIIDEGEYEEVPVTINDVPFIVTGLSAPGKNVPVTFITNRNYPQSINGLEYIRELSIINKKRSDFKYAIFVQLDRPSSGDYLEWINSSEALINDSLKYTEDYYSEVESIVCLEIPRKKHFGTIEFKIDLNSLKRREPHISFPVDDLSDE